MKYCQSPDLGRADFARDRRSKWPGGIESGFRSIEH
jgi:hypothetical protein